MWFPQRENAKINMFFYLRKEEIKFMMLQNSRYFFITHNYIYSTDLYLVRNKPLVTARKGEIVACFLILRIMIGIHESLADVGCRWK